MQGALSYPNAAGVPDSIALQFFDHYMRDIDNGYESNAPVRYYQMGSDEWKSTNDWNAMVQAGDTMDLHWNFPRELSRAPQPGTLETAIDYDPRDPSPTFGGPRLAPGTPGIPVGPQDQRDSVESRSDVLIIQTPVLTSDLAVVGAPTFQIYVNPNAYDTDIAVRLCDVYPDGRSMLVAQGIKRLRFRYGLTPRDTSIADPSSTYRVGVELQNIAMTWRAGHRCGS